jgi:hypothetical protein
MLVYIIARCSSLNTTTFSFISLPWVAMPPFPHYIVEVVLEERAKGRGKQYLVKWEDYPNPTWRETQSE